MWRYLAFRMNGDGTETFLRGDLPVTDGEHTTELSGVNALTGYIAPEVARLQDASGMPVLVPWSTAVFAEDDGVIVGGGIVADLVAEGPKLLLDCVGFAGYADGMPYIGEWSRSDVDPLVVERQVWSHLQSQPGGDLGLVVDAAGTATPVRVGTKGEDGKPAPFVLADYATTDLGAVLRDLASQSPYERVETHSWVPGTDTIRHELRYGYPRIGRRRTDRYVVGENVTVDPRVSWAEYASEVLMQGAGEGRSMVRGRAFRDRGRLRRVAVEQSSRLTRKASADAAASARLSTYSGEPTVDEIAIRTDPPSVGDEIRILGSGTGWGGSMDEWVRVISVTRRPDVEGAVLTVRRAA